MIKEYKENGLEFIEVEVDDFKVILCSLGASIYEVKKGNDTLTLTPNDSKDYKLPTTYHGKTIGRLSNRVREGKVVIDNKEYQLDLNERGNCLHYSKEGLSNKVFDYQLEDSKVIFHLLDKASYLPGDLDIFVIYKIIKDNLRLEYKVTSNKNTVIRLTNHAYFTLGERNIDNLRLMISADKFIEVDKTNLLPLREKEVSTYIDFRVMKPITLDIHNPYLQESVTKGYDHHFIFNDEKHLILKGSKYRMDITTDMLGVQIYTENYEDDISYKNTIGKNHRGVAIEPQDSTLEATYLPKGETYSRFINYSFIKE